MRRYYDGNFRQEMTDFEETIEKLSGEVGNGSQRVCHPDDYDRGLIWIGGYSYKRNVLGK